MASSSMLSAILAISMLFSSFFGAGVIPEEEMPAVAVTIEAQGDTVGLGLNETTTGLPVGYITHNDEGLYFTTESALLNADGSAVTVPMSELSALASQLLGFMPTPTEQDLQALLLLAQGVLSNISVEALSISYSDNSFSIKADVDKLLDDLDAAIPATLNAYGTYIDPTLEKYSPVLFGQTVTSAQLALLWPQLGLSEIETDLTLELAVTVNDDGSIHLEGAVPEMRLVADLSEDGFSFTATTADGTVYPFDTDDLITLITILGAAPEAITTEAFNVVEGSMVDEDGNSIATVTYALDMAALSRDLNKGIAQALITNASTVDALLNKYRPWIALAEPSMANFISANLLGALFQQGLVDLGDEKGELVLSTNYSAGETTVDGSFAGATLTGTMVESTSYYSDEAAAASFTLAIPDAYSPLLLNLDFIGGANGGQYTLTSSEPFFGNVNTLTLNVDYVQVDDYDSDYDYYSYPVATSESYDGVNWAVTTDSDEFRLSYSDTDQRIDLKIGSMALAFTVDANEVPHFTFSMPEFFANLTVNGDSSVHLDTSYFGVEYLQTYNDSFMVNGYIMDEYGDPTGFGVDFHEDTHLYAYLNGDLGDFSLMVTASGLVALTDGESVYTLTADPKTELVYIAVDGVVYLTLAGEIDATGTVLTIWVYDGTDVTVDPDLTLTIDMDADPVALPGNAQQVDIYTFCNAVEDFFE